MGNVTEIWLWDVSMLVNENDVSCTFVYNAESPWCICTICKTNPNHLKYLEDVRGDDNLDHFGNVVRGRELQLLILLVNAELMGAVAPPLRTWGLIWCWAVHEDLSNNEHWKNIPCPGMSFSITRFSPEKRTRLFRTIWAGFGCVFIRALRFSDWVGDVDVHTVCISPGTSRCVTLCRGLPTHSHTNSLYYVWFSPIFIRTIQQTVTSSFMFISYLLTWHDQVTNF